MDAIQCAFGCICMDLLDGLPSYFLNSQRLRSISTTSTSAFTKQPLGASASAKGTSTLHPHPQLQQGPTPSATGLADEINHSSLLHLAFITSCQPINTICAHQTNLELAPHHSNPNAQHLLRHPLAFNSASAPATPLSIHRHTHSTLRSGPTAAPSHQSAQQPTTSSLPSRWFIISPAK